MTKLALKNDFQETAWETSCFTLLHNELAQEDNHLSDPRHCSALTSLCILYIFGRLSAAELKQEMNKSFLLPSSESKLLVEHIRDSGYFKDMKLWLFSCYHGGLTQYDQVMRQLEDYNLHPDDGVVATALKNSIVRNQFKGYLDKETYDPISLKDMETLLGYIWEDTEPHTKKRVNKKLRFIADKDGTGVTKADLVDLLQIKGLTSAQNKWPRFDCYAHMVNCARTSINNESNNIIDYFTTKKNAVLNVHRDENGKPVDYSSIVTSIDKKVGTEEGSASLGDLIACPQSQNTTNQVEYGMLVDSMLESAESDMEYELIAMMIGLPNADFSAWLAKNATKSLKLPSDDVFEKLYMSGSDKNRKRYEKLMLDYLNEEYPVKDEQGNKVDADADDLRDFLEETRQKLGSMI